MTTIDTLFSARAYLPKPYQKSLKCARKLRPKTPPLQRSFTVLCKVNSSSASQPSGTNNDDFVSRVLKENPNQIEPRYLIGDKFYNLKEKENLGKNVGFVEFLAGRLNFKVKPKKERNESQNETEAVYLKDILREYKGKLYVPEQIFSVEFSEEEEFDRNLEELPIMSLEDFNKAMKSGKVKLLTSKEIAVSTYQSGYRNFVVDLKEIPGDKSLHRTKW